MKSESRVFVVADDLTVRDALGKLMPVSTRLPDAASQCACTHHESRGFDITKRHCRRVAGNIQPPPLGARVTERLNRCRIDSLLGTKLFRRLFGGDSGLVAAKHFIQVFQPRALSTAEFDRLLGRRDGTLRVPGLEPGQGEGVHLHPVLVLR